MRNSMRFMVAACILAALPVAASAAPKHSWIKPGAVGRSGSGALVFVTDYNNNVVDIYSASNPGSLVGQIAGYFNFPGTLAVDAANNLYVYNGRTNGIMVFQPPYTNAPVKQFYEGLDDLTGMSVDAAGTIYTADYFQVVEFQRGDSRATYVNLPVSPTDATVDSSGRLVAAFTAGGGAGVFRMSRNSPVPQSLQIPLTQNTADLLYDTAGNLVVESAGGAYINIYAPGKTKPLASWATGFITPNHMAMSADGATLYVSDAGNSTVKAFAYPSGQQLWQLGGFGYVLGVAVAPALVPGGRSNVLAPFPAVTKASLGRPIPPIRPDSKHILSLVPHNPTPDSHPSWARFLGRHARHNASQDEAWVGPIHYGAPVQRYALPNSNNSGPNCATPYVYGVNDIGLDFGGNLWVPAGNNGPRTGTVQEYTCAGSVGSPISDNIGQPSDVAFDGNGTTVVGDIITYLPYNGGWYLGDGIASAYDKNGNLLGSLSDPTFFSPHPPGFDNFNILDAVANDPSGNCYVSHVSNSGAGEVVEFPGCKPAKRGNVLKGPHPWSAGKVTFDAAGNMLVTDFSAILYYRQWYVSVYAPPYNKAPILTIPMFGPAVSCGLDSANANLYCADTWNGNVDVYSYPGGTYEYSFNNGLQTWGAQGLVIIPGGSR